MVVEINKKKFAFFLSDTANDQSRLYIEGTSSGSVNYGKDSRACPNSSTQALAKQLPQSQLPSLNVINNQTTRYHINVVLYDKMCISHCLFLLL